MSGRLLRTAGDMEWAGSTPELTRCELRILRLVGRGLQNEEIAKQASISPSTVRSHLKNIHRKLELNSRSEAVSFAVRNSLS